MNDIPPTSEFQKTQPDKKINLSIPEKTQHLWEKIKQKLTTWKKEIPDIPAQVNQEIAALEKEIPETPPPPVTPKDNLVTPEKQLSQTELREAQNRRIDEYISRHPDSQNPNPEKPYRYNKTEAKQLFGPEQLKSGSTKDVWYNPETGVVTYLFSTQLNEYNPEVKKIFQTFNHQKDVYKQLADQHPFFSFIREIPGGWQTEYVQNSGNILDYKEKGGTITPEMAKQAISDYRQMVTLSGEAHGDLVKPKEELPARVQGMYNKEFAAVDAVKGINNQQILVTQSSPGESPRLVIMDWGGAVDPYQLSNSNDPKSDIFKNKEAEYFVKAITSLVQEPKQTTA